MTETFSTWAAIRSDIKDKLADFANTGEFMTVQYRKGDFLREIRSVDEAMKFLQLTYKMESLEFAASNGITKSYGSHRRFDL